MKKFQDMVHELYANPFRRVWFSHETHEIVSSVNGGTVVPKKNSNVWIDQYGGPQINYATIQYPGLQKDTDTMFRLKILRRADLID